MHQRSALELDMDWTHGLDWSGLDQDFQETLWIGLDGLGQQKLTHVQFALHVVDVLEIGGTSHFLRTFC